MIGLNTLVLLVKSIIITAKLKFLNGRNRENGWKENENGIEIEIVDFVKIHRHLTVDLVQAMINIPAAEVIQEEGPGIKAIQIDTGPTVEQTMWSQLAKAQKFTILEENTTLMETFRQHNKTWIYLQVSNYNYLFF